ncbi:hypothetical protein TNCV_750741 [Trichonephila clavipes]|nr:hypothetical protein TNCV_750741 [Trichonephila clavipes]
MSFEREEANTADLVGVSKQTLSTFLESSGSFLAPRIKLGVPGSQVSNRAFGAARPLVSEQCQIKEPAIFLGCTCAYERCYTIRIEKSICQLCDMKTSQA